MAARILRRPADARIAEVLGRLLPKGTTEGKLSWSKCPEWPPDLFAVAASVLERHGAYALSHFTVAWEDDAFEFSEARAAKVRKVGRDWRRTGELPPAVQAAWTSLLHPAAKDAPTRTQDRARLAIWLLAVADEASMGMGFGTFGVHNQQAGVFAALVFAEALRVERGEASVLPSLPNSLCRLVPPSQACVQPKTNVPGVGITLRSLSHHLALLPPRSVVETEWLFAAPGSDTTRPLNLLLVPLPYRLDGDAFRTSESRHDKRNAFFTVDPTWLNRDGDQVEPETFYEFIRDLVLAAQREAREVHGVVLPEGALPYPFAKRVAGLLARRRARDGFPALELFIAGVTTESGERPPASWTYAARLHGKVSLKAWRQKKHHRWRLDADQVRRYQLGHVLDPAKTWWERIDVNRRTCKFTVVRPGATLAVLVCEDLARTEPVMPVINAVGPNLVVALLMDGPQLESRWSSKYATVLADDPGSSVLTLTCRGMIRRSSPAGFGGPDVIGLWKQQGGATTQLMLPNADHALLICLTSHSAEQFTLDLRSDDGGSVRFELSSVMAVRLRETSQYPWLNPT